MLDNLIKNKKDEIVTVTPSINIYSENENIVLAVEIPGVDKDTLDVHIDGDNLHIGARKKRDEIGKEYCERHKERKFVEYKREFELNPEIDRETIKANYEHGILKVTLQKKEAALPKKIAIKYD